MHIFDYSPESSKIKSLETKNFNEITKLIEDKNINDLLQELSNLVNIGYKYYDDVSGHFQIYSNVNKITKYIIKLNNSELLENWINWLNYVNDSEITIYRKMCPPIRINFSTYTNLIASNKYKNLKISIKLLNRYKDNIENEIKAIDKIMFDGIGEYFGSNILNPVLKNEDTYCVLAYIKKENGNKEIVGAAFGTVLDISGKKIFYIWFLGCQGNFISYGIGNKLSTNLKDFVVNSSDDKSLNCVYAQVRVNNQYIRKLCKLSNFNSGEILKNSYANEDCLMMNYRTNKNLEENSENPKENNISREVIYKAIIQYCKQSVNNNSFRFNYIFALKYLQEKWNRWRYGWIQNWFL